jgi:N-acetylglucosamine kinase-like BadF-type ATPase
MILIADSGSTKTLWMLLDGDKRRVFSTTGINPFFLDHDGIIDVLSRKLILEIDSISEVFFYGAGCTPAMRPVMKTALEEHFYHASVSVFDDLTGAARALFGNDAGIACIIGTGSNSCVYDGKNITDNIPSLGYIIGDEGSGTDIGKRLIAAVLRNRLPAGILERFYSEYRTSLSEILDCVYRQRLPNRYIAQFAVFAGNCMDCPEVVEIVESSFAAFVERRILPYPTEAKKLPVGFTGSVAYSFREILEKILLKYGLVFGKVGKNPLDALATYHSGGIL